MNERGICPLLGTYWFYCVIRRCLQFMNIII